MPRISATVSDKILKGINKEKKKTGHSKSETIERLLEDGLDVRNPPKRPKKDFSLPENEQL